MVQALEERKFSADVADDADKMKDHPASICVICDICGKPLVS
jgi:hypothetical protein